MGIDELKIYIVSCHVDKKLQENINESKFNVYIQAGAALTDQKICEVNDHDDFDESISVLNARCNEATAMYWVWKHLDTPYVGIGHYRRRLGLSDEQIETFIHDGVDLITTRPTDLACSIEENWRKLFYNTDWDLLMEILEEHSPEMMPFINECVKSHEMHVSNINLFRSDLYREMCEWAFPILFEFCERSPQKTDIYQHRDGGFVSERLTHFYIMKKIREGRKFVEAPLLNLKSDSWKAEEVCDLSDPDAVFDTCNQYYKDRKITQCFRLMREAIKRGIVRNEKLSAAWDVLAGGVYEMGEYAQSMHDYLPYDLRSDLTVLIKTYRGLEMAVYLYFIKKEMQAKELLEQYLSLTHFSVMVLERICKSMGVPEAEIYELERELLLR